MKLVFPDTAPNAYQGPQGGIKRNYILLAVAALQILEFYYLCYDTYSTSLISFDFSSPTPEPLSS